MKRMKLLGAAVSLLALAACGAPGPDSGGPVFFPPAPDAPRVQFLRAVTNNLDIEASQSSLDNMLFGDPRAERWITSPHGVTFFEGIFYVADSQIPAIVTLDFAGGELGRLPLQGRNAPESPVNVQFAEDGRMFVSDVKRRQVLVYDRAFRLVRQIGPWSEDGRPAGMSIRGDRLYVSDPGDQKIRVFDLRSYEELLNFDGREAPESTIVGPTHLFVTEDLDCYVSDSIRNRIFVFDKDGNFSHHIGTVGRIPGTFSRPKGLAIVDDLLFAVDAAFENCQILTLEGQPLMFFGGPGEEPGNLYLPAGIHVGREGLEYFADDFADGFVPEFLIAITNYQGPQKVSFFALGKHRDYDYSIYEQPPPGVQQPAVEAGGSEEPPSGD